MQHYVTGIGKVSTVGRVYSNTALSTTLDGLTAGDQDFSTSFAVPASSFVAGKLIRVTVYGKFSTDAGAPGTFTFKLKGSGTTLLTFSMGTPTAALTDSGWTLYALVRCNAAGAGGTVVSTGHMMMETGTTAVVASAGTQAWDTTASTTLKVSVAFGSADADNKATIENVVYEVIH
jgi:hypothetical protein